MYPQVFSCAAGANKSSVWDLVQKCGHEDVIFGHTNVIYGHKKVIFGHQNVIFGNEKFFLNVQTKKEGFWKNKKN